MKLCHLIVFCAFVFCRHNILAEPDATSSGGILMGKSGYILHHGQGELPEQYAIALYVKELGMPALTLLVNQDKKTSKIIIMRDFGDKIIFYTDTDGDGLADEGIERDKQKQTLRKFKIRFTFEDVN